ncbi:MAG: hypothetical protein IKP27_07590 [Paludibacteraceae bacterium]|nr:hypothetical protein [Paludibacteraceae bacterium]
MTDTQQKALMTYSKEMVINRSSPPNKLTGKENPASYSAHEKEAKG